MTDVGGCKILVLGADGFVGANLCHHLVGAGALVTGFGHRSGRLGDVSGLRFVEGDAQQLPCEGLFEGQEQVVHLIGTTTPASSDADILYDIQSNLVAAIDIFERAARAGVRKLVFLSSGGTVYGPNAPVPTPESAETNPICSYGIVKLAIEKYLQIFEQRTGMTGISLRVSNPFGPYQYARRGQGAIAAFIANSIHSKPLHIWGDGTVRRDYLFIDDLSEAIVAALQYEGMERVFNIGSGESRSLNEVVASIRRLEPNVTVSFEGSRPIDVPISQLAIEKARKELGWSPQMDWHDGVKRTFEWALANPDSVVIKDK